MHIHAYASSACVIRNKSIKMRVSLSPLSRFFLCAFKVNARNTVHFFLPFLLLPFAEHSLDFICMLNRLRLQELMWPEGYWPATITKMKTSSLANKFAENVLALNARSWLWSDSLQMSRTESKMWVFCYGDGRTLPIYRSPLFALTRRVSPNVFIACPIDCNTMRWAHASQQRNRWHLNKAHMFVILPHLARICSAFVCFTWRWRINVIQKCYNKNGDWISFSSSKRNDSREDQAKTMDFASMWAKVMRELHKSIANECFP